MYNLTLFVSLAAIVFYALGFATLWRTTNFGSHTKEVDFSAIDDGTDNNTTAPSSSYWLTLAAIIGHAFACVNTLFGEAGLSLSLIGVSNLVAVVMVCVVAVSSTKLPVNNIFLLLFPISIFNLLCLNLIDPGKTNALDLNTGQVAHILLSITAYAALMTAALQSVLLAVQESRLKRPSTGLYGLLPALETMEHLLLTMLWIGLGLLSLSIITGLIFLEDMLSQRLTHHTILTSLSWLVYAGFLAGHHIFGWRGVTAVRWNLAAFALLVLGYFGSKFVLEYLL
jgi:ABC-type uncharacterized transport system permease subunit